MRKIYLALLGMGTVAMSAPVFMGGEYAKALCEAWNTMFQGLFTRFVVDAGLLEGVEGVISQIKLFNAGSGRSPMHILAKNKLDN